MFSPRMVENFFKRTRFRRSKRIRSSFRASLIKKGSANSSPQQEKKKSSEPQVGQQQVGQQQGQHAGHQEGQQVGQKGQHQGQQPQQQQHKQTVDCTVSRDIRENSGMDTKSKKTTAGNDRKLSMMDIQGTGGALHLDEPVAVVNSDIICNGRQRSAIPPMPTAGGQRSRPRTANPTSGNSAPGHVVQGNSGAAYSVDSLTSSVQNSFRSQTELIKHDGLDSKPDQNVVAALKSEADSLRKELGKQWELVSKLQEREKQLQDSGLESEENGTSYNVHELFPKLKIRGETKGVNRVHKELRNPWDLVSRLQEREKQLQNRLSEQAQRQLEKGSTKFEDLSLGDNRPTQLIKRYGNLYTEARVDALDALDELPEMVNNDDLKVKLLLSIVVLAFRSAQKTLQESKTKIRDLLHIPRVMMSGQSSMVHLARELEDTIALYLRKTIDKHDLSKNYAEVCDRVWSTLYDYPSLKDCRGLLKYVDECVRIAWALTIQNPPLVIDYESKLYNDDLHMRFHLSDSDSTEIKTVLWPMLTEGEKGACVCKGVVLT